MKKLLIVTLLTGIAQLLQAATVDKNVEITIGGETRNYQVYVPNNVQANCPLVVSLHGANGASTNYSPFTKGVADQEGCIVAYPQGKQTAFPIGFGGETTGWTASGDDNFDAKFLKAVIEDVASKYQIDRKRIYCCGFSNGGMMTYAISNACSDVFAAFASISGYPINEFHLRHTGSRPVPFLHIHGKNDDFVLYSKMPTIVDEMVARLGANPVPVKTTVSGKYTKSVYAAGEGSFPYVYYEIDGMGHNEFTTNTEDGTSAQTMWNFFEQYTLDSSCDPKLKWRPRIETTGFTPTNHGWTMNSGTTLLEFGGDQYTADNKNVYHSLQFDSGKYKLCFKSTGAAGKTIGVKIQKIGASGYVIDETVNVGENAELPFEVTDGWGEYKLTMTRTTASDAIAISDIEIKQTGDLGLIEIPQENVETNFTKADIEVGTDYTTYTTKEGKSGQLNIAIKTLNVNVEDCDYVVVKFAEPIPSGWVIAFWGNQSTQTIPAGSTEYKFVFAEDPKPNGASAVNDNVLNEITMMTMWTDGPITAKVKGIYKHRISTSTTISIADNPASTAETLESNPENFAEIAQDQGKTLDDFARTEFVQGDDYNTYTCTEGIQVAFKMFDIDVKGCDFVIVKFAEPVKAGWELAFWGHNDQSTVQVPAGSTEYKYVFANDAKCAITNNILPQLTMLRLWTGTTPLEAKVAGVYKHIASDYNRTYSFNKALDFTGIDGLEAYVITAFNPAKATLTLSKVKKVPANTGLYLVGKSGEYDIPVIESADAITTNLLHASSGTDALNQTEGSYTNLIFGGTGDNRGFHPLNSAGVIGANKAYLQLPTAQFNSIPANARLSFIFEDETTAIKAMNEVKVANGAWYTVSGVKLNAKPIQKGIYINNGKKIAIQ